ncbi:MAG: hypothetical protein HY914_05090 [Desulfomonile tiedjei]|nr:hypothetical protein [Desulfomonile tiedjei]
MPGKICDRTTSTVDVPEGTLRDPTEPASPFDPSLVDQMREIVSAGLTPSSALDLVMRLIAEVPAASKESMDQIKVLDKLINTARAMMETKIKSEEAAAIAMRLDDLERRIQELLSARLSGAARPAEVWNDAGCDG